MGADLPGPPRPAAVPVFVAAASRDPQSRAAQLQEIQIVKGWIDVAGELRYRVFDVAGDRHSVATVDEETGERSGTGYDSLCALFSDPEFDASLDAYYYMRVIELPSPRWSLFDCLQYAAGERPAVCEDPMIPRTIREMAWTAPVWYEAARLARSGQLP